MSLFQRTIVKTTRDSAIRLHQKSCCRRHPPGRFHSSKSSNGGSKKLDPLPSSSSSSSSPSKAKQQYLKSKEATDKYLDPQEKMLQLNRELEIVRNKHAEKLEKELQKSIYRRLVDPLVRHKHSLYNILAMTIAYVLAHNLYVTSKQEKECRAELEQSQEENLQLKQIMDSLREESTLEEIGLEIARELNQGKSASSWFNKNSNAHDATIAANVLRRQLLARIGQGEATKETENTLSAEEIMLQNQEQMKKINSNPELLLQDALQQSSDPAASGDKSKRVFSM